MRSDAKPWAALAAALLLSAGGAIGCQSTAEGWPVADDSEWREGGPNASETPSPDPSGSALGLETVYFDFDAWSLGAQTRERLKANAKALAAHPQWGRVTVEGHCDVRGSEEYNLLLGQRRADEVVGYLGDLGVPASRLATVSFGEARPAVVGYDETAFRWNRRTVFRTEERTAAAD